MKKLLITNAEEVLQITDKGQLFLTKSDMKNVCVLKKSKDVDGFSIVVDESGKIERIGRDSDIRSLYPDESIFEKVLSIPGKSVVPGLIDGHTHPVWAGDRVHEFAMKLAGASYMEVHEAGGGINFTVEHTRKASEEELTTSFCQRLNRMIKSGTTTVECKSGYGLNLETEMKMLRVIENGRKFVPIEISSTFCGAHSVPKGMTPEEATENVITKQIPAVLQKNLQKKLQVENIDVFCEKGVFNVAQSKRILEAGTAAGLHINFHGDELNPLGGAEMGASLHAKAISHLEEISSEGISAMAASGSTAVILPTTAYMLRLKSPPVREMIDSGVIVALGSDFNPNAFCLSMPTVMHLACVNQKMSLEEAMVAATLNSAHSLNRSETHGSLEAGKFADMLILDAPKWEHLIYQFGGQNDVIEHVIKNGEVVYSKN
ncbi:probable imidazolonepropionase [Lepeophtheirus salmonis]|uniref:probable imidazolonepropionase n=1 Tax=Lepeophtheirus salmonis TaxID=72036 RepID=UPI001AE9C413|nr:probable imidazolonepropionase [Lepeophtheirus salmonis]